MVKHVCVGEIKEFCTNSAAEVADQCKGKDSDCIGEAFQVNFRTLGGVRCLVYRFLRQKRLKANLEHALSFRRVRSFNIAFPANVA